MTLDKHQLDGIPQITAKTMISTEFESLLVGGGYSKIGRASAKANRIKVWWSHSNFRRIEAIYTPDGTVAITAYHV